MVATAAGVDARQRPHLVAQPPVERDHRGRIRVARLRQHQLHRHGALGREPGLTRCSATRLRTSRPGRREEDERQRDFGDDQRSGASARRARRCRRGRRPSARRRDRRATAEAPAPGRRGCRWPSTRAAVNTSTLRSTCTVCRRGICTGLMRTSASTPHSARTRAARRRRARPGRGSSISNWRTMRPRLAPSAVRTAISRRRAVPRASSRLAMFAHAISRTAADRAEQHDQPEPVVADQHVLEPAARRMPRAPLRGYGRRSIGAAIVAQLGLRRRRARRRRAAGRRLRETTRRAGRPTAPRTARRAPASRSRSGSRRRRETRSRPASRRRRVTGSPSSITGLPTIAAVARRTARSTAPPRSPRSAARRARRRPRPSTRPRSGATPSSGKRSGVTTAHRDRRGVAAPVSVDAGRRVRRDARRSSCACARQSRKSRIRAVVGLVAHRGVDRDEPRGVGERQRLQQHAVDDAEDGGVGADAEREHEHDDHGEARGLEEETEGLAEVSEHEGLKAEG